MALFLYSLVSSLLFLAFLPLILVLVLGRKKYRSRFPARLGLNLPPIAHSGTEPVIWVHALSVGEVTSALPLLRGLRATLPGCCLVLSTTTATGAALARDKAGDLADVIVAAPYDLAFVHHRFIRFLRPDIFLLVETDFWPGWLRALKQHRIPIMLVNGRFSDRSRRRYHRMTWLVRPMFACFSLLALQTEADRAALAGLGIAPDRLLILGNLKYDAAVPAHGRMPGDGVAPVPGQRLVLCGSTHRGEEEIILSAWQNARPEQTVLVIALRDIGRCDEIMALARDHGLTPVRRSRLRDSRGDIILLDTYGELAAWYHHACLAFIGGSLVAQGGHNPLEAAAAGIPVLFGPHMDDFSEISRDLVTAGAALTVHDQAELTDSLKQLLADPERAMAMGRAGTALVRAGQGVVQRHIRVICSLLDKHGSGGP